MYAKRFGVVIAVLCLGLLSAPASAQTVNAWLYSFYPTNPHSSDQPWTMGIYARAVTPSNAIFGHVPQAGAMGEIAVIQGIISVGDEVPLPSYADGSQAQDSEVFWTAQLWRAAFPLAGGVMRYSADYVVANFSGRQFVGGTALINYGGPLPGPTTDFQVLVNVVAVRSSTTPTRPQSWGSLKARYH